MQFSSLRRYPIIKNDLLQAWNSSDQLLLESLEEIDLLSKKILIINDSFGAISFNLKKYAPQVITDSYISYKSIHLNTNNQLKVDNNLDALSGVYDFVLIVLPKNLSYFEDILISLQNHINTTTNLICSGMIKHMSKGHFDLLNQHIGPTRTSLAKKKARLIYASNVEPIKSLSKYPLKVKVPGFENKFINYSNVFSRDKLDIGSRFFLDHIPKSNYENILDLACGNGIIGIKAKMLNPMAKIFFRDESYMAILSSLKNYKKNFDDEAQFTWSNCYEDGQENIMDLVLCNPPFHQNHTVGDFIAISMFHDAKKALKSGGELIVIGNSHLAYQVKLRRIFGNSQIIASNKKFMIIKSIC